MTFSHSSSPNFKGKSHVGEKHGYFTIIEFSHKVKTALHWVCRCDCGNIRIMVYSALKLGNRKSCGCRKGELISRQKKGVHGCAEMPEYNSWRGMCERCTNPSHSAYRNYGGRGIKIDERWLGVGGFKTFLADMGPMPSRKHSIDRIDNDGDYCPENCRWATRTQQNRNSRKVVKLTHNGVTMCIQEWAEHLGVSRIAMQKRIKKWGLERALSEPARPWAPGKFIYDDAVRKCREHRERIDISVEQLAKLAGVRAQTIDELESGTRRPSIDTLRKIRKALGCDLADFN